MLKKNHGGGHKVNDNCHLLQAFAGIKIKDTNVPEYKLCMTKSMF